MNKLGLIIRREYLTRIRKKSFIFATIAVPLGFTLIPVLIILLTAGQEDEHIAVVDESGWFKNKISAGMNITFDFPDQPLDSLKRHYRDKRFTGILYIPSFKIQNPNGIQYYSQKGLGFTAQYYIQEELSRGIGKIRLSEAGVNDTLIANLKSKVVIESIMLTDTGEKSDTKFISMAAAYIMGFLMYMTILIYGVMVMNGVLEEKTNRIVELMISSVKPFQILMGKIIGIALVGLTQFSIWIMLFIVIMSVTGGMLGTQLSHMPEASLPGGGAQDKDIQQMMRFLQSMDEINFGFLLVMFFFYFIGGYFMYSALYAAAASAANDPGDVQSLSLPVTLPIIMAFVIMNVIVNDPGSPAAFWFSMIPLTSPIIMMARIPFGVPWWELTLSVILLILGFIGSVWLAAKIYRTGILMYGKKASFKELGRWLFYKA